MVIRAVYWLDSEFSRSRRDALRGSMTQHVRPSLPSGRNLSAFVDELLKILAAAEKESAVKSGWLGIIVGVLRSMRGTPARAFDESVLIHSIRQQSVFRL